MGQNRSWDISLKKKVILGRLYKSNTLRLLLKTEP